MCVCVCQGELEELVNSEHSRIEAEDQQEKASGAAGAAAETGTPRSAPEDKTTDQQTND